jgi:hypothetical protein
MSTRTLSILALLAPLSGGCGRDTDPDPNASAIPVGDDGRSIAATKDGITAYIMTGDYLSWAKEPAIRDAVRAHGTKARSSFNAKYLQARRSNTYPMVVGAMSVKELYNDTTVYGYAVSVKTQAGEGAQTWTWYETTGLPNVQYFGVANPTCEGCHSADSGRDRSLAPTIP